MNIRKDEDAGVTPGVFFILEREDPMGNRLVIAEKPSVAQSIAKVIGADRKRDGYLEGSGYLVSWCFGHLVELCEPQEYDRKFETER